MKSSSVAKIGRIPLLDVIRGVLLIGMAWVHLRYLLVFVFDVSVWFSPPLFWFLLGRVVGIGFLLLAGVSAYIMSRQVTHMSLLQKTLKRALILFLCSITITITTLLFLPEQLILFGILHFFSVATLLSLLFLRAWYANIIFAGISFLMPEIFTGLGEISAWFIPLGWYPRDFFSADYYPVFPWFSAYLLGITLGYWFDRRGLWSHIARITWGQNSFFCILGKHSLVFYMLHVPVIYGILYFFLT